MVLHVPATAIRVVPAELAHVTAAAHASEPLDVKADYWRPDGRSFVALSGDAVVGHARATPNPIHPGRRAVLLEVSPTADYLAVAVPLAQALQATSALPLALSIEQSDTTRLQLARELDARVYQMCPPWQYRVTPAMQAWARGVVDGPNVRVKSVTATDLPLLANLWTDFYVAQHESWSPTAPREQVAEYWAEDFDPAAQAIDLSRSVLVEAGRETDTPRICGAAIAWDPESEDASEVSIMYLDDDVQRTVEICIAGVVSRCAAGQVLEIDSHYTLRAEFAAMQQFRQQWGTEDHDWTLLTEFPPNTAH